MQRNRGILYRKKASMNEVPIPWLPGVGKTSRSLIPRVSHQPLVKKRLVVLSHMSRALVNLKPILTEKETPLVESLHGEVWWAMSGDHPERKSII